MKMMSLLSENASRTAMEIGGLTGLNKDAVQKFVDTHNMDIEKVYQYVKKSKLTDRLNFVTAIVGTPGNPVQKKLIKMFGESVTEGKKRFRQQYGIGKSKYTISYHDGVKKHKDGSDFFDIQIFKNQKDVDAFKKALLQKGFVEESVNEAVSPKDMEAIKSAVTSSSSFMNIGAALKKTGLRYIFATSPMPVYIVQDKSGNRIAIVNKKYADKPDFVHGDTAVGVMESIIRVNEVEDHEVSMAQNSLDSIIKYATELKQKLGEMEKDIPAWIQDHITNAENYVSQAASNYHEYGSGMNEGVLNEMDRQLNVKVNKMLSYELGDLRKGGPNHLWAVMHVLIGALRDANFHSELKKVPAIFGSKAKYEGDPQGEKDLEDMYEYDLGPTIAALAKWDGKNIVDAIGFYASMNVGRPVGEKIEKLVEGKK